MENFEYIDGYFKGERSPEKQFEFEQRIESDPVFAEDVAFYIAVAKASREETLTAQKERFRNLSMPQEPAKEITMQRLWPKIAAAAAVISVVVLLFVFLGKDSPDQMASTYMDENLSVLPVQMSTRQSELQQGITLYNEKKYDEARQFFETKLVDSSSATQALRLAGLSALQTEKYDLAITYFNKLENLPGLHANPGKFYHAVALMKRDAEGDREQARTLLQDVIRNDLFGSEEARQWLPEL